jgi:hypothetical protein
VSGLCGQLIARQLGLLQPRPQSSEPSAHKPPEPPTVELLSRPIPVTQTQEGMRAVVKGQPINPATCRVRPAACIRSKACECTTVDGRSGRLLCTGRPGTRRIPALRTVSARDPVRHTRVEATGELDLQHIRSPGKRSSCHPLSQLSCGGVAPSCGSQLAPPAGTPMTARFTEDVTRIGSAMFLFRRRTASAANPPHRAEGNR